MSSTKVKLAQHKIDLSLFDEIANGREKVMGYRGSVSFDIDAVKKAITSVRKIESDLNSTDELANELLKKISIFEKEASILGVSLPNEVINTGQRCADLLKENDNLRKLINLNIK